jgi:hypothetical protein
MTHTRAVFTPNVVHVITPVMLTHTRGVFSPKVNVRITVALLTHSRVAYQIAGVSDGSGPPPGLMRWRPEHGGKHER